MNDDMFDARTYGLLAEFDSLGFLPTTLTLDPEKTANEWKVSLIAVIEEMYNHINVLNSKVKYLKRRIDFIEEQDAELRHRIEATEKATATILLAILRRTT